MHSPHKQLNPAQSPVHKHCTQTTRYWHTSTSLTWLGRLAQHVEDKVSHPLDELLERLKRGSVQHKLFCLQVDHHLINIYRDITLSISTETSPYQISTETSPYQYLDTASPVTVINTLDQVLLRIHY